MCILTVKILEVGQLDALAHAQDIGGGAEAVEHHPEIAGIQGRNGIGGRLRGLCSGGKSMLDVCPGRYDGAEDHQAKREQGHGCDGASEPEHLAVGNYDDGEILENGIHRNGEELDGPGTRVDHADEEEGDGEP